MRKTLLVILIIAVAALSFTSCEKETIKPDYLYTLAENTIKDSLSINNSYITTKAIYKEKVYLSDVYYKISNECYPQYKQQFVDSAIKYKNSPNNFIGTTVKVLSKYYITHYSIWNTSFHYMFYYNNKPLVFYYDCDIDNFIKDKLIFKK